MTKHDRIYLENTNRMHAVADQVYRLNEGAFFVNQIRNSSMLHPEFISKTVELSDR